MKNKVVLAGILSFFLFNLVLANQLFAQDKGVLSISLNVISNQKALNEASIKFTKDGEQVELSVTQSNGRYTTVIPYGDVYLISVEKENCYPKTIEVDTRVPETYRKAFYYQKIIIALIGKYEPGAVNNALINKPFASIKFNDATHTFETSYNTTVKKEEEKAAAIEKVALKGEYKILKQKIQEAKLKAARTESRQDTFAAVKVASPDNLKTAEPETTQPAAPEISIGNKDSLKFTEVKKTSPVKKSGPDEKVLLAREQKALQETKKLQDKLDKKQFEEQVKKEAEEKRIAEKKDAEAKEQARKETEFLLKAELHRSDSANAVAKQLKEKARKELEELALNEKKQAAMEQEKRKQEVLALKLADEQKAQEQARKTEAEQKRVAAEKLLFEEKQKQDQQALLLKEKADADVVEKAKEEALAKQKKEQDEKTRADNFIKEMQAKAQQDLLAENEKKRQAEKDENMRQDLVRQKAKEELMAIEAAREAIKAREAKMLEIERNEQLKGFELASLIEEYKAFPKGREVPHPSYKIFRIVIKQDETNYVLYRKSTFSFGEYYFRNKMSITRDRFIKDTQ